MSFSPTILQEAKALAKEMLSYPKATEMPLPIGSSGSGLVLTVIKSRDALTQFEQDGRTFYIVLPNIADDEES